MSSYLLLSIIGLVVGILATRMFDSSYYGKRLSEEKASHASDIAKINAESYQQLQEAVKQKTLAESKVSDITNTYNTEIAKHAKDTLDYRTQLANNIKRLRVHVSRCDSNATSDQSPSAPSSVNGSAASADLSPTTSERLIAVVDSADSEMIKLKQLQGYVSTLQNQGYIEKTP